MQPGTGKGGAVDKRLALLQNRAVSMSMSGASGSGTKKEETSNKVKPIRRSKSTGGGDRWDFGVKVREEPKKPGYCENCRIKYDDFKTVSFFCFSLLCFSQPNLVLRISSMSSRTNIVDSL